MTSSRRRSSTSRRTFLQTMAVLGSTPALGCAPPSLGHDAGDGDGGHPDTGAAPVDSGAPRDAPEDTAEVPDASVPATFAFYIGPSGSDANDGLTPETAWAITALNDPTKRALYAGARVGILDGTYGTISIFGQPERGWQNNAIEIKGGTAAAPTFIGAVRRFGAIIDGERPIKTTDAEEALIGPLDAHVVVDGLKIVRADYQAVACYAKDHFTLQNFWIDDQKHLAHGSNSASVTLTAASHCVLRNGRITDSDGGPSERHEHILWYADGRGESTDNLIEYLSIDVGPSGDGGNGIYFKQAGPISHRNVTVRHCAIDRSGSSGVGVNFGIFVSGSSAASDEVNVYGNIVDAGPGRAPLFLVQMGHAGILRVHNNTFVGDWNDDGGAITNHGTHAPATLHFFNNILARTRTGWQGDVRIETLGSIGDMDHNCYDTSPPPSFVVTAGAGSGTYTSLAAWQAASGKDAASIATADPQFVGGAGTFAEQYALQTGSPARVAGLGGAAELGAYGATGYDALGIGYSDARS